ncbi:hypothetical protein EJ04DRAFT_112750 [Polyplosphaeria fusca]|uniref:Uncharacterized protein n=1 Tax=Polyplosphaeria fusca TaxID=682080 RepID=A0A9P4V7L3_9PLEO|nr:hypothetical protein EJ04DRAFT_112750 [Polyplosphaeria fusca]
MHKSPFGKDKKPKQKNKFFKFDMPMVAEDRELNLLGVAFENPRQGTRGEFTPQGRKDVQVDANKGILNTLGSMVGWSSGQAQAGASNPSTAAPQTPPPSNAKFSYTTPCKWPTELVDNIYPNKPTPAIGVEACVKKVKGTGFEAVVKTVIAAGLGIEESELDTIQIPVLQRYSMESPRGKINALLHDREYRSRLINLFEQQDESKKRVLWVATNLITCGGVSYDVIKKAETEASGGIQDPTKTVPVKIGGKWHSVNDKTLKGTYSEDIVLFMSYRRVRYVCVKPENPGRFQWLFSGNGNGQKHPEVDAKAIDFDRPGGIKDVFWIEDDDAEGDVPAFFSPEHANEDSAVFEDGDAIAGAEDSEEEEEEGQYPDGFFSQSEPEQE